MALFRASFTGATFAKPSLSACLDSLSRTGRTPVCSTRHIHCLVFWLQHGRAQSRWDVGVPNGVRGPVKRHPV
ncbi:hypothetical protein EJ02DRAFT_105671 [Clathrospora elynae]|uniref:Uncharacterized protein n=1 Tax=Clathrospora elynae TaxID=706981 RepID=A0A6A5S920_9PLEO|nr:hypothetical protein EJ02DRAFT_105671 [Clathrospora elynae]